MLAESLFKFGAQVYFYDTELNAPGFFRTPYFTCGPWNDEKKLHEFFSSCDIVTYEFENVSIDLLDSLAKKTNVPLFPSAHVLAITQNRIFEKNFLKENLLPLCDFLPILNEEDLNSVLKKKTFPFILKTALGGYDGKGQWKINNLIDFENFLSQIKPKPFPLVLEEIVSISKEISCITARNKEGKVVSFPAFENEHRNHILYQTLLPAEISPEIELEVQKLAQKACEKLNVVGLLTTEFFITTKNEIVINEFAPRPHNSGHITTAACQISQYDVLARILLDLPLHKPVLQNQFYCMGNILGDVFLSQKEFQLKSWELNPDIVDIRLYGKQEAKEKRKMGHFIATGNSREKALEASEKLRKEMNEYK